MREIKFRAWDKQTRDWLHLNTESTEWYNKRVGVFREFFDKHVHLMQYTGLKDKNGREIYEGDIIEFHSHKNFLAEVIYQPPSFCVRWFNQKITRLRQLHLGYEPILPNIDIIGVVVGNVYEHPELLDSYVGKEQ